MTTRLAVLISGAGSNLQAILDAERTGALDVEVVVVVCSRPTATGVSRAERVGVPTRVLSLKVFRERGADRGDYDSAVAEALRPFEPELVVLAGWMHILGPEFLSRVRVPVLNLHPALPGEFPGTHAIERAHRAARQEGLARTGVMVHHVVAEVDAGPVVLSEEIPLDPEESLDALEQRVHAVEHRLLVAAIGQVIGQGQSKGRAHAVELPLGLTNVKQ